MKISVGICILNSDFFLPQVLESVYNHAHAICIAEGPVKFWQEQGLTTSTDRTNDILASFPDPENKIKVIHGKFLEKTEQCQAWFSLVPHDTDYVLCVDADEVHSPENLTKLIDYLQREKPTDVGFMSESFYGGFDRVIGGFERGHSFKRVLQYQPGCQYLTHRQPTLSLNGKEISGRSVSGTRLFQDTGISMWHGSYVSAFGVWSKLKYYESAIIAAGQCIPDYFNSVWLPWVMEPSRRPDIETMYKGVQEFKPATRGEAYTQPFTGNHPPVIERDMKKLINLFWAEVNSFQSTGGGQ